MPGSSRTPWAGTWSGRPPTANDTGNPAKRTSHHPNNTYAQIRRLRARATRRHRDWQHKTTTALADQYGTIVVEDLSITSMTRSAGGTVDGPGRNVAQKAGLNRAIAQEAWGRPVAMSGQGTTLALVGAYVLARELSRPDDLASAVSAYEARMRPYAKANQDIADRGTVFLAPRTRLGLAARDTLLRFSGLLARLSGLDQRVAGAAEGFDLDAPPPKRIQVHLK